jgi:uncharacterized membrane protein YphA (DoxX/SURF4 family)
MNMKSFAPVAVRIGLAMVVMWFGLSELIHPSMWTSYIPAWLQTLTHLDLKTLVILNGLFEVVGSLMLAYGIWTRWIALILFLHMAGIVQDVGLDAVGMRDLGLAFGLFSVFLQGGDMATFDDPAPIKQVMQPPILPQQPVQVVAQSVRRMNS